MVRGKETSQKFSEGRDGAERKRGEREEEDKGSRAAEWINREKEKEKKWRKRRKRGRERENGERHIPELWVNWQIGNRCAAL